MRKYKTWAPRTYGSLANTDESVDLLHAAFHVKFAYARFLNKIRLLDSVGGPPNSNIDEKKYI